MKEASPVPTLCCRVTITLNVALDMVNLQTMLCILACEGASKGLDFALYIRGCGQHMHTGLTTARFRALGNCRTTGRSAGCPYTTPQEGWMTACAAAPWGTFLGSGSPREPSSARALLLSGAP